METYYGHVRTPADAIILFEACRIGLLPRVQRRLTLKERAKIRTGSVFVWDEREAGMRRWTDGRSWSDSRIAGSFLIYREMEAKPGGTDRSRSTISGAGKSLQSACDNDDRDEGRDEGPDGWQYKPDGLTKLSFSMTTSTGQRLHLISYYCRSHPAAANLQQPTTDTALRYVHPQRGLYPESIENENDQQIFPVVTRDSMGGDTPGDVMETVHHDSRPNRRSEERTDSEIKEPLLSQHISAERVRDSPSMHQPRSPALSAAATKGKTVLSETTRNDLLWTTATPENLQAFAAKGDMVGVANILNVGQKADTESMIAAAKGGHDEVISLLLGIGDANPDPDPVFGGSQKPGYNTPMLAAIGRGNLNVIRILLNQPQFNPTRRPYKDRTYYELSRDRRAENWEEEFNLLRGAYENHSRLKKFLRHENQQKVRAYSKQLDVESAGEVETSERPWTPGPPSPGSADTTRPIAIDEPRPLPSDEQTFVDVTAVTDSGYGSLTHRKAAFRISENSAPNDGVNHNNQAYMQEEQPLLSKQPGVEVESRNVSIEDDTGSLYSETSSLGPSAVDGYVATLAEEVSRIISPREPTEEVIQQIYETLPQMLKALSLSIGSQQSSRMHREVMVFIHKHRRRIAEGVRDILSDEVVQSKRQDACDGMSLDEKMSKWLDSSEYSGTTAASELPDTQALDEESEADSNEELLPEIAAYKDMIQSAPSYAKLKADLWREVGLAPSTPNVRKYVHNRVLQMLPESHRISRQRPPETFSMTFMVDWNPLVYVREQEYLDAPDIAIENAIVITGSTTTAQAMTCAEYLQQTWPSIGIDLLELIQKVIRSPSSRVTSDGTPIMTAWLAQQTLGTASYLSIDVTGHASWIAEIAEVLAWIGSALRSSTNSTEIVCYSPLINQMPSTPQRYKCMISYSADCEKRNPMVANGKCWHNLFREPVIAKGYPIARRPRESLGLELSLSMMSVLTQTPHLNPFGGSYYIKGYSTMLVPTQYGESIMTWHLLYDPNGKRIPYFDGWDLCHLEVDISNLQAARHILGWCSEMKLYAGAHDTSYNIQNSLLPEVDSDSFLSNISISKGRIVANGPSYCLGKKAIPDHVTQNGYARKLKWISKKFVLLWDEEDRRGWLINGTSVLLHLVRTSLERDSTSDFSSLVSFNSSRLQYPLHSHQPGAAAWTLSNQANRALQIYDEEPPIYFQEYVTGFYDLLEKIMDHEAHNINNNHARRSQLEGWDFDDIASERVSIYPRVTQLDPVRTSWIDLIRSVHGITLFGRKFGDIIKPVDECLRWSSLPCGESYLAVSKADLKEIMTARRGNLFSPPFLLTDSVIWYIPEGLSDKCSCKDDQGGNHSDVAQILLPASMAERLPRRGLGPKIKDTGAVIFGNNSTYEWSWADGREPSKSRINRNLSQETKGSPSDDSGLGNSMSSFSFPGRESGTTTGSSLSVTEECPGSLLRNMDTRPTSPIQLHLNAEDYNVAIICALDNEWRAVRTLFDSTHASASLPSDDPNAYAFGSMGGHNIVATCLPQGEIGTSVAADVTVHMKRSFPWLAFCLIIGIGGGVPVHHDIRLGDVVVSTPRGASVGVLPYDRIKNLDGGITQINGYLQPPPRALRSALNEIQADPRLGKTPLAMYTRDIADSNDGFTHPGVENDILYMSNYPHPRGKDSCSSCDVTKVQARPPRDSNQPRVHYGLIASGNQVLKNALTRDKLGREYDILCFEMEAAGIMNNLPSLVIRGICDYCDSHKNKDWQKYAAATAAAFAKLLLSRVRPGVEAAQCGALSASKPHELGCYGKRPPVKGAVLQEPGPKRRRAFE